LSSVFLSEYRFVPSDKRPTLQAAKLVPSHMAATGRIEKRIACIQTLKHQRKRSLRAAERAGKHGRVFAQRWLSRKKRLRTLSQTKEGVEGH
jgi:hypothetical protein